MHKARLATNTGDDTKFRGDDSEVGGFRKHAVVITARAEWKEPRRASIQSLKRRTLHRAILLDVSSLHNRSTRQGVWYTGLSTFRDKAIPPDYTKPVDKVFAEAAAILLQQDAVALYIQAPLYPLHEDPAMLSIPDLPFWVPDLRIAARAYTDDYKFSSVFNSTSVKNECHPDIVLGRPLRFLLGEISARVPFPHVSLSADFTSINVPGLPIDIVAETLGALEDALAPWDEARTFHTR